MDKKYKYGYMCKVDYDYHLGEDIRGTLIYPSLKILKNERKCVLLQPLSKPDGSDSKDLSKCGIVKVKIELEEVIEYGKFIWSKK